MVMIIQLSEDYWRRVCAKILEEPLASVFRIQREINQSAGLASDETSTLCFGSSERIMLLTNIEV